MTATESATATDPRILIDTRLDTIDRMLIGRVSRADRIAIVGEVEAQIHELLSERYSETLTREDVLSVLARLDPPEAYLPEESAETNRAARRPGASARYVPAPAPASHARGRSPVAGLAFGGISLLLILPSLLLIFVLGDALGTEVTLVLLGGLCLTGLTCGIAGLVLSVQARSSGAWAITGIVGSVLGMPIWFMVAGLVFLAILSA